MAVTKRESIYASFFLNIVHISCSALQLSTLPYISKELNLDNVQYGYIQTALAAVQMIGNPIFCHLCSRNIKLSLALAYFSAALSYFLTSISNGFYMLMVSRLVCLMVQTPIGIQTVISTITTTEERTVWFSRLGATFGLGFISGAILGGALTSFLGYFLPSFIGCIITLAMLPVIYVYVPDNLNKDSPTENRSGEEKHEGLLAQYIRIIKVRQVFNVLLTKCFCLIPLMVIPSIIGVYLVDQFNVSPSKNAVLTVYNGVSMATMNIIGMGILRKKYAENTLMQLGFCTTAASGLSFILISHFWQFFIAMPLMVISMTLVGTVADSLYTSAVDTSDHAVVLGLDYALDAGVRVIGPTVAGYMLKEFGLQSFGYAAIVGCSISAGLFSTFSVQTKQTVKSD